jgi:RNA polymerase sigma-70 factor (ECF subfamily)
MEMIDQDVTRIRADKAADTLSDSSLLRRFRGGNDQAATELYRRYAGRLYRLAQVSCAEDLARRLDPEDIVQSVFSSFFRRARDGHYFVPAGEELWKLLLVIALNKIRAQANFHRAARRNVASTLSGGSLKAAVVDARHDERALSFLRLVIDEILAHHVEVDRQIIVLRIDGHDVAEIAERVCRSRRTVERVLQAFREELRASLHETEE